MRNFLLAAVLSVLVSAPALAQDEPPNEFNQAIVTLSDQMDAAENGSATAQYNLGMRYATGDGVVQDWEKAAKWLRASSDNGDMDAQVALGTMYQKGQGVAKDDGEAVNMYRQAARQGQRQAQYNLGAMYASGRGTNTNKKEAYFWLSLASTLPNPDVEAMMSSIEGSLSPAEIAEAKKRVDEWRPEVRDTNNSADDDMLQFR